MQAVLCVMDRLQPAEFMAQLLHVHAAEDAFQPLPQDEDDED